MAGFYGMGQLCPQCGYQFGAVGPYGYGPGYGMGMGGMGFGGFGGLWGPGPFYGYSPPWGAGGWGLGGLRTWGGTYSPQYLSTGLPTDEEITEMVYDALDDDVLIPWDADINVDVKAGEVTLTGTVPNKNIKHSAGDDAWWVPGVVDVHNQLEVSGRHRYRAQEAEQPQRPQARQATGRGRRGQQQASY
ncbi:MAG: BON domain-containing protein [Chloroflexota bacterium]